MRRDNLYQLPDDLPIPVDDGASNHLVGMQLPSLNLLSTAGREVDLSRVTGAWTIVFCYPRTGRPDREPPGGVEVWNQIPGARGCTPQTIAFRNHYERLRELGAEVYGLSTQDTAYQQEVVARLQLPFELLSDEDLLLTQSLNLPTFHYASMVLLKRLTMIIKGGIIVKVFYPVFPPNQNASEVIAWIRSQHP